MSGVLDFSIAHLQVRTRGCDGWNVSVPLAPHLHWTAGISIIRRLDGWSGEALPPGSLISSATPVFPTGSLTKCRTELLKGHGYLEEYFRDNFFSAVHCKSHCCRDVMELYSGSRLNRILTEVEWSSIDPRMSYTAQLRINLNGIAQVK